MRRRIRELLDRLRDWWQGEPGRHTYPRRRPINIVSLRLVSSRHGYDTELAEADERLADALLRSLYPRLFWSDEDYWRESWRDFCITGARQVARVNEARRIWRAEVGLAPAEDFPTLPIARLAVAS